MHLAGGGLPVLLFEHRHEKQVAPGSVTAGCIAHGAFNDKTEARVEVTGGGVVLVDIEKKPVGTQFLESHPGDLTEELASEPSTRSCDYDALQLDGLRVFAYAAQDDIALQPFGSLFAHQVAGVGVGHGDTMALFAPLTHELAGSGCAFEPDDAGKVREARGPEEHEE